MKIYIAIWEDRHTDITVHPFSDRDKAIEWAKKRAQGQVRFDGSDFDEVLTNSMKSSGWIYYGCYSDEGSNIHVVETELDNFD
jgi:hypothetical protein